jgi:hypothetical protein
MAKVKSPLFGTMQVRFLKAGWFKKGVALVGNPAPWVVAGWRALRPRQLAVVGTLVKLAQEWDQLPAEEKAKYSIGGGPAFRNYVKQRFHQVYQTVLADLGVAAVPKKVRVPKGALANESFYRVIKEEAARKLGVIRAVV